MGGAVGRFALRGRCLILDTDGTDRTPVFAGMVSVRTDGIVITRKFVPYGSDQLLPMIGPPVPIKSLAKSYCPQESLVVRSVGD